MPETLHTLTPDLGELQWAQPRASRRTFELRSGERLVATLAMRSVWGTLARAETAAACWTFKRVGFFQQRVEVRPCDSDTSIGMFVNATWAGGGTLTMPDGRTFRATTNFWSTKWRIEDEHGAELLRFDYGGVFRLRAHVHVADHARDLAELPLLLTLSWYLIVMLAQDAASSTVIIG